MTVTAAASRVEYSGNAVTVAFTVPFYFLANGDLKVYLGTVLQTITTHYTVTGAGNPAGGTVTFVTAPGSSVSVVIYRDPTLSQSVDYQANDPFPPETHETALDRLTMISQRLDDRLDRALTLADSSTATTPITFPDPQAGYYLQWKADLSGLQNVVTVSPADITVSAFGATLVDDADAAAARVTLGNVATFTGAETLTNKILTSPTLNGPALSNPVLNGALSGTAFLDEDTMVSNSATATSSQQSIKAYVDGARAAVHHLAANQSIPTSTWTKLNFPNELYDTASIHDNAVNNTRLTVPDGWTGAEIIFNGAFDAGTGQRIFELMKNNVSGLNAGCKTSIPAHATYIQMQSFISPRLTVVGGDYFEIRAFQDHGSNRDVINGASSDAAIFSIKLFR